MHMTVFRLSLAVASGFRSSEDCLAADVASGFSRKEAARPFSKFHAA
jgi:hypothetical protein